MSQVILKDNTWCLGVYLKYLYVLPYVFNNYPVCGMVDLRSVHCPKSNRWCIRSANF